MAWGQGSVGEARLASVRTLAAILRFRMKLGGAVSQGCTPALGRLRQKDAQGLRTAILAVNKLQTVRDPASKPMTEDTQP